MKSKIITTIFFCIRLFINGQSQDFDPRISSCCVDSVVEKGIDSNRIPQNIRDRFHALNGWKYKYIAWDFYKYPLAIYVAPNSGRPTIMSKYRAILYCEDDEQTYYFDSTGTSYDVRSTSFLWLPSAVKNNFVKIYPGEKDVTWDEYEMFDTVQTRDYYVAQFKKANQLYSVTFDSASRYLFTSIKPLAGRKALPKKVKQYIRQNFPDYKFASYVKITDTSNAPIRIMVRLKSLEKLQWCNLNFTMDGGLKGSPELIKMKIFSDPSF